MSGDDESETARRLTDGEIDAVVDRYRDAMPRYEAACLAVETRLRKELRAAALKALLSSRAKHPEEVGDKLRRLRDKGDGRATHARVSEKLNHVLTDLAGARVIVYHPEEEASVLDLVKRKFSLSSLTGATERKRHHYRASHALVEIDESFDRSSLNGTVVEIQISSLASHAFNELEHDIRYKSHGLDPTQSVDACLDDLQHATRLLDRVVERLLDERNQSRAASETLLAVPEELRHALERRLERPMSGDFVRLHRLLNPVVDKLTPAVLDSLGEPNAVIDRGRSRAQGASADDVVLYALGLIDVFGAEFRAIAKTWRGPETELKRAILATEEPE
jgi:ppGpp synthetase/RelA/SpoT-type nucleotidyltranferase